MQNDEQNTDLFKHMNELNVSIGQAFLKSAILINGGAAVAVLGFVASIARADSTYSAMLIGVADAIMFFAWGVMASLAGIGSSYLMGSAALNVLQSQSARWQAISRRLNDFFHVLAVAAAFSAALSFLLGALAVRDAVLAGHA
ncbi:hypothetical protein [Paracoccus tibetensis]|uniref:hypothetical protein n=1 Tax=Paracoccus tibetensis TaxID=336292 RepID=UPI000B8085DB|nr:hypothetical protein [Paracoccus tibetensis]